LAASSPAARCRTGDQPEPVEVTATGHELAVRGQCHINAAEGVARWKATARVQTISEQKISA